MHKKISNLETILEEHPELEVSIKYVVSVKGFIAEVRDRNCNKKLSYMFCNRMIQETMIESMMLIVVKKYLLEREKENECSEKLCNCSMRDKRTI